MTEPSRRFPAPWHADKIPGGYVIRDANRQARAYVYARATTADAIQAKVLTQDEARRIALNIAQLPELVHRDHQDANAVTTRAMMAATGRNSDAPRSTTSAGVHRGTRQRREAHGSTMSGKRSRRRRPAGGAWAAANAAGWIS
jgi:hypothetical protein